MEDNEIQQCLDRKWTTHEVIDFSNWYLKVINAPDRYSIENLELLKSFLNNDQPEGWHTTAFKEQSIVLSELQEKYNKLEEAFRELLESYIPMKDHFEGGGLPERDKFLIKAGLKEQ